MQSKNAKFVSDMQYECSIFVEARANVRAEIFQCGIEQIKKMRSLSPLCNDTKYSIFNANVKFFSSKSSKVKQKIIVFLRYVIPNVAFSSKLV